MSNGQLGGQLGGQRLGNSQDWVLPMGLRHMGVRVFLVRWREVCTRESLECNSVLWILMNAHERREGGCVKNTALGLLCSGLQVPLFHIGWFRFSSRSFHCFRNCISLLLGLS